MQPVALRDTFDGRDCGAVMAYRQREAGVDPPSVDEDRAGAALAAVASLLGSGEVETLAQQVEQRDAGVVQRDVAPLTVDGETDRQSHAMFRSVLWSGRIGCGSRLAAGMRNDPGHARTAGRVEWRSGQAWCSPLYGGFLRLARRGRSRHGDEDLSENLRMS